MKNPKPNLSKGEQKAMEELAKRKDIIITNVDKGGGCCSNNGRRKIHQQSQPPAIR